MMRSTLSSDNSSRLSVRRRELLREQRLLNIRRFFRNGHAVAGALIVLIMILLAVFAPLLAPADPLAQTVVNRFAKPGTAGYLLGADKLGRDLLSRIIYGARVSMIVGVYVVTTDQPHAGQREPMHEPSTNPSRFAPHSGQSPSAKSFAAL